MMKIIVGLGNIGEKYQKTRHNCGFMVVDMFAKQLESEGLKVEWKLDEKFQSEIAKVKLKNETILLVKPATFMNLSGQAVSAIFNFFKESLENLIVIYDDIDLPLGKIRIRDKGSAGTHNGMKSVIQALGSENFKRIRIGIESRGELTVKEQDLHSFVLTNFNKSELPLISRAIQESLLELRKML